MRYKQAITSQDVFAVRRSGEIDRAYTMAKTLIANPMHDDWDIRALAYCLCDLATRANTMGNQADFERYAAELKALNIDKSDNSLIKKIQTVLNSSSPAMKELELIRKMKESEQPSNIIAEKARALYRKYPQDMAVKEYYGWRLYDLLKIKSKDETPNFEHIQYYLNGIFSLGLTSQMFFMRLLWRTLLSIHDVEKYIRIYQYVLQMDFTCFEDSDYKTSSYVNKNGKTQEGASFVIKLLKSALDSVDKDVDKDVLLSLFDLVDSNLTCINEDTFYIKWSYAKALQLINEVDRAQSILIELLSVKPEICWLWNALAETLGDEHQYIMSCYCKSILCNSTIKENKKARLGLVKSLIALNMYEQASAEINQLIKYGNVSQSGENVINDYIKTNWYIPDLDPLEPSFYEENSQLILELQCKNMPWYEGVVGKTFTKNDNKFIRLIIIKDNDSIPVEFSVNTKQFNALSHKEGTSIRVKIHWIDDIKGNVLQVQPLDYEVLLPHTIGVVSQISSENKKAYIIVETDMSLSYTYTEDNSLCPLDVVSVTYSVHNRKDESIAMNIFTCEKVNRPAPSTLQIRFVDFIRLTKKGVAFTERKSIFIDERLVSQFKLTDGSHVTGIALRSFNKRRNSWGWRAAKLLAVDNKTQVDVPNYWGEDYL